MEPQASVSEPVPATPTPVVQPRRLPKSLINALIIMTVAGGVAALALPRLDQATGSATPGLISFGGMTAIVIVLTAIVLRLAARAGLGLSQRWLMLALTYNTFVVAVKFWLAPASLYLANQTSPFSTQGWGIIQDPNSPLNYLVVGVTVGFLYLVVFYFLTRLLGGNLRRPKVNTKVVLGLAVIVGLVLVTGGSVLLFPLFFGGDATAYLSYVFSSPIGSALGLALALALVAAVVAIRQAVDDEVASGQTTTAASFFALGLSLIVIYHILWIVYMIGLVSIWPFKTVTPK